MMKKVFFVKPLGCYKINIISVIGFPPKAFIIRQHSDSGKLHRRKPIINPY